MTTANKPTSKAAAKRKATTSPAIPRVKAADDIRASVEIGAAMLREHAPALLKRAAQYANDPSSPCHETLLRLFLEYALAHGHALPSDGSIRIDIVLPDESEFAE